MASNDEQNIVGFSFCCFQLISRCLLNKQLKYIAVLHVLVRFPDGELFFLVFFFRLQRKLRFRIQQLNETLLILLNRNMLKIQFN